MKFILLTPIVLMAVAAAVVSSPGKAAHACGSMAPLNNNPGTSGYVGDGNTITTNANGTRTLVLQAGTRWEQTHNLPAVNNTCPSGGNTPVTPLLPDLSGTRIGMTRGYQHPMHRTNVPEVAPRRQTGADAPNSAVEVPASNPGLSFSRRVSQMFEGDFDTYTATSSDTDVATVRKGTCTMQGSSRFVHAPCITVTAQTPAATTTPRTVHGVCMNDGEGHVVQNNPQDPPTFVQTRPPTCETVTLTASPLEEHEATITVTATNTTLNRTATVTFTVTVYVDPNP